VDRLVEWRRFLCAVIHFLSFALRCYYSACITSSCYANTLTTPFLLLSTKACIVVFVMQMRSVEPGTHNFQDVLVVLGANS